MSERVSPLLKELEWTNVGELTGERDILFINRLLYHPFAPHKLRNAIIHRSEVSSRDTWSTSAGLLQLPRVHTELAKRFFMRYRVAAGLWNKGNDQVHRNQSKRGQLR